MLYNLKHIRGHQLSARDGAIGHVKDFYFDDKTWAIRYLVADTGNWLTGRQVLISPYAFGTLDPEGKVLSVNLTRQQIENSPSIDEHRPVSRQFEQSYYSYYGWPNYWIGGGLWGEGEYPTFVGTLQSRALENYLDSHWEDLHLRSTNAVNGYALQATDGTLGNISGFLVDQQRWQIRELTVETGHWYSGKEILITPDQIERISFEDAKVFVKLTKKDLERTQEHQLATAGR